MRRAVFLDRDGTLNRALVRDRRPHPARTLDELEILPGVAQALARFRRAGLLNVVITNQPDVARGTLSRQAVETLHSKLSAQLLIDAFYTCWHDDQDRCACRKPLPGLILQAARELGIDVARSVAVGDRWRDIAAGQKAGCMTVWIDCGYDEPKPERAPDLGVKSLAEAVDWIPDTAPATIATPTTVAKCPIVIVS